MQRSITQRKFIKCSGSIGSHVASFLKDTKAAVARAQVATASSRKGKKPACQPPKIQKSLSTFGDREGDRKSDFTLSVTLLFYRHQWRTAAGGAMMSAL